MKREVSLQTEIIKWLKSKGCYVIKTRPGLGTPVGCPDVIAFHKQVWIALEVKKSEKAEDQPGQKETIRFLKEGNPYGVWRVSPENWPMVQFTLNGFFIHQ